MVARCYDVKITLTFDVVGWVYSPSNGAVCSRILYYDHGYGFRCIDVLSCSA